MRLEVHTDQNNLTTLSIGGVSIFKMFQGINSLQGDYNSTTMDFKGFQGCL